MKLILTLGFLLISCSLCLAQQEQPNSKTDTVASTAAKFIIPKNDSNILLIDYSSNTHVCLINTSNKAGTSFMKFRNVERFKDLAGKIEPVGFPSISATFIYSKEVKKVL